MLGAVLNKFIFDQTVCKQKTLENKLHKTCLPREQDIAQDQFSFSETGCLTKAKKTQSALIFTLNGKENNWILFPRELALCEIQSSSRI